MSDELRLPDDLAACEARLAAMPLGASGIDRGELLYRAGWSAGAETARFAGGGTSAFRLRSLALCSAASAALAASLAVAITLRFEAASESESLIVNSEIAEPGLPSESTAVEAAPPRGLARRTPADFDAFDSRFAAAGRGAPFLALRRGISLDTDGDAHAVASAAVYVPPEPAKTARQLLEELLPSSAARPEAFRPSRLWPFGSPDMGDTI
jgi:hypothetical protein